MTSSDRRPRPQAPGSLSQLIIVGIIVVIGLFCGLPSFALWAFTTKKGEADAKNAAKAQLADTKPLPTGRYIIIYPMRKEILTRLVVEPKKITLTGIADTKWYSCVSALKDLDGPRQAVVSFLDGSLATLTSATCDTKTGRRVLVFTADHRFGATFSVSDIPPGFTTITIENGKVRSCPGDYAQSIGNTTDRRWCNDHPFANPA